MQCDECQVRILERTAGELDPRFENEVESHLEGCEACAREARLLESIGREIRSVGDVPVPRHFFVYEEKRGFFDWLPFARQYPGWAVAFSVVVLLAGAMVVASLGRLNVRYAEGALVVAFGELPPLGKDQASWRAEVLEETRLVAREENEKGVGALRDEMTASFKNLRGDQERYFEQRLGSLETELAGKVDASNQDLQRGLESTLVRLGTTLASQHQSDILLLNRRLERSESLGRLQVSQTDAVMSALVQISDARQRP